MTTIAVLGSAIIAFHMEVMEFLVVTYTSSLTLSITGIIKVSENIIIHMCSNLIL